MFWPLVALFFSIGAVISHAQLTAALFIHTILVALLLPLITFGVNDVYDYASDRINKRKGIRSAQGAFLPVEDHAFVIAVAAAATAILFTASLIFSLLSKNFTNIVATATALAVAWAYSVPPIRLKERPPLDSLSNAALIWSVILLGFSHGGSIAGFPRTVYFASLIAASIHAIAAIVDYFPDKRAGVRTIATVFEKRVAAVFSALVSVVIIAFSGIMSLPLRAFFWYVFAASLLLVVKSDERLAKRLAMFGFLAALFSITLFIYQQFFK